VIAIKSESVIGIAGIRIRPRLVRRIRPVLKIQPWIRIDSEHVSDRENLRFL
jgi:hypothetical protein